MLQESIEINRVVNRLHYIEKTSDNKFEYFFNKLAVISGSKLFRLSQPQITTGQTLTRPIVYGNPTTGVVVGYEIETLYPSVVWTNNFISCASNSYHDVPNIEKSNVHFELIHKIHGLSFLNIAFGATQISVTPPKAFFDKMQVN